MGWTKPLSVTFGDSSPGGGAYRKTYFLKYL